MYKTISNEIIRTFNPCYDPSKVIKDENEELPIKDWIQKYMNVVPAKDILWLLLRKEFMPEKDLILFVVRCAREALKLIEKLDEISVEVCNVVEKYANGEATKEELLAARNAAHAASTDAAYYAAHTAYYIAYDDKADIAYAISHNACYAAYYAAYASYAAYAVVNAVYDVDYDARTAIYAAQVDKLLTYFE